MKHVICCALFLLAGAAYATTNNDDSCDIGLYPAATLLLPHFEVDVTSPYGTGQTTLFTITNTSNLPQIAHVTLWTDWSYPVIDFNLYLTGYDVQSINLYDVIVGGRIAPEQGTGSDVSPVGALSGNRFTDVDHDNPLVNEDDCVDLPVTLPQSFVLRMLQAFTLGRVPASFGQGECRNAGGVHANAMGYATIDVVSSCTTLLPTDADYFRRAILFDNVLMGDYQQVDSAQNYAQGNPMVHIRAIPEGGSIIERAIDGRYAVPFSRTFYSRYQPEATKTFDARQPMPATFGARWISAGTTSFQTHYKIWREGRTGADAPCNEYFKNGELGLTEIVRFDEEENPETWAPPLVICTPSPFYPTIPASAMLESNDTAVFPPNSRASVAGWMYLNLDRCNQDDFASQAWITVSMRAEGRYSVDSDAVAFGNGCSPPLPQSQAYDPGGPVIGPPASPNP